MVTLIDAGALQGYSGTDHLIDESEIKDAIGRDFDSVKDALQAVGALCWMDAHGDTPRRQHGYVWVDVRIDGEVKRHQSA